MMMWRSLKAGNILAALAKAPKAGPAKSAPLAPIAAKPVGAAPTKTAT